jgi:1,2-diacylglycerol 3-alpha-glucosyltransferase
MSNVSPTVAVLFYRVGPYHFARLRAAGQQMRVTVMEYSNVDPFYAWDEVAGQDGFERVTLFKGVSVEQQSAKNITTRVRQVLSELRPEVVAVPGWHDRCALAALKWCYDEGVPTVVMSETTPWDFERKWWKEAVKQRIVRCYSTALVGGTPHKDYMVQLGMPAERVFLGYDAVDNRYFADKVAEIRNQPGEVASPLEYGKDSTGQGLHGPGKAESRNKLGLPEKYFLATARFVEQKNLPRLIEAYARYRELAAKADERQQTTDNRPSVVSSPVVPWSLVLLGDGPLREALNSQLLTLNLHDHVHLPGFKQYEELPAYYGLASVFVHASTIEPWGLVVNEAMASGLPVLVSNRCGCAMDLVKEGVNGFTFDPYNIEQLAQLMLKISAFNPVKRRGPHGALRPPLSAFGSESQRIISEWGPDRFANGLKQAVECALRVGPVKPTLLQRMILKALLAR